RLLDEVSSNSFGPFQFTLVLQLDLSSNRRHCGVDIRDTGNHNGISGQNSATFCVAHDILKARNWKALADSRPLIDALVHASLECNTFNDLPDEPWNSDFPTTICPCFLFRDLHTNFY